MSKAQTTGALTALIFCLVTTPAVWADSDARWYGAIKTSIGEVTIDGITDNGSIGTGAVIGRFVDGQIEDDEVDDYTAGLGFAIGRRMGYWQISAEYIWRYRTDWDIHAPTPSIGTVVNIFSNVETNSLLFNVARRGPINQDWSWEVGAGFGLVNNNVDAEYIEREIPGVTPEISFDDDDSSTEFSYNVFLGVTRDLGGPWTLNIRYRYIDLGELEAGPFPNRAVTVFADHQSQELQFSLERNF